jgi:hypothetical protein
MTSSYNLLVWWYLKFFGNRVIGWRSMWKQHHELAENSDSTNASQIKCVSVGHMLVLVSDTNTVTDDYNIKLCYFFKLLSVSTYQCLCLIDNDIIYLLYVIEMPKPQSLQAHKRKR